VLVFCFHMAAASEHQASKRGASACGTLRTSLSFQVPPRRLMRREASLHIFEALKKGHGPGVGASPPMCRGGP